MEQSMGESLIKSSDSLDLLLMNYKDFLGLGVGSIQDTTEDRMRFKRTGLI